MSCMYSIFLQYFLDVLDTYFNGSFWAFRFEAMVLGAGRGPLVEATLKAAERAEAGYVGLIVSKCLRLCQLEQLGSSGLT